MKPFYDNKILCLLLAWHIIQVLFITFNLNYQIAPDEAYHIEVAKLYAQADSWRLRDSTETLQYGTLSVAPYLYHRALGAISFFTAETSFNLLALRLVSVLFSIGFILVVAKIACKLSSNKVVQVLLLAILSNIPKLQLLGGAVTYDNVINFLSALLLLQSLNFWNKAELKTALSLINIFLLGSLIKITFVPWIVLIGVIFLFKLRKFAWNKPGTIQFCKKLDGNSRASEILAEPSLAAENKNPPQHESKCDQHFDNAVTKSISGGFKPSHFSLISFCLLILLSCDLYGRNLVQYGWIQPSADKVLGYERAYEEYPQFRRNEVWRSEGKTAELMPFHTWFQKYLYMAAQSTFGIQAHRNYGRTLEHIQIYQLTFLPILVGLVLLLFPGARKRFKSSTNSNLLIVLSFAGFVYFSAAVYNNYNAYVNYFRTFGHGLQGRYLFPSLPALLPVFACLIISAWHKYVQIILAIIYSLIFFGLGNAYIFRDSKFWQEHLRFGAVWDQDYAPKAIETNKAPTTLVLLEQNQRTDGYAASNQAWFAQEIILDAQTTDFDFIELFLIAEKEYQFSLHADLAKPSIIQEKYIPKFSGFNKVPFKASITQQKIWLVIKGTSPATSDFGTSTEGSNPYLGKFLLSNNQGKDWTDLNRDLYFKLLKTQAEDLPENTRLITEGPYGDARLLENNNQIHLFTSLNSVLYYSKLLKNDWLPLKKLDISADWISLESLSPNQALIACSSSNDKSLRIYQLELSTLKVKELAKLEIAGDLIIDPALVKAEENWFLSATSIMGTPNRKDSKADQGEYSILLFKSKNLQNWEETKDLVSAKSNLEDPIIEFDPKTKTLYFLYEEETLDQGPSSLMLVQSTDLGTSWSPPQNILKDGNDNEPAALKLQNAIEVYYSSDHNKPGSSYQGADAYRLNFGQQTVEALNLPNRILLSDVLFSERNTYFAYFQDYLEARKLLVTQVYPQ